MPCLPRLRLVLFLAVAPGWTMVAGGTGAADIEGRLEAGGSAAVIEVIDGDTLRLGDGRQVRLVGLQAPKLPLGRPGFVEWPLAETARQALAELTRGRTVRLAYGGARMDRYRRALAHLFVGADTWVQGEMLSRGLARVYTFPDNRALAAEMYAREEVARRQGRGIWGHPFYRLRTAETVKRDEGTFQIVEAGVLRAARVRDRVFLNFAQDWRDDFTVTIDADILASFVAAGLDPLALEGTQIRVRGWIKTWNGPLIEATHPEQIEVLSGR
ncbi:thermonuclease family protein [Shumkonia mesophila]|uniref:thermonuclease family protein n=1 Tax=Shumkonia mesophila TaxID=2838854 RepID=UPI00293484B9|nr:thermonuclease family protein [Shumkonia mesophila]